MTGAGGGAGPGTGPRRQWDVALSFAGSQQEYVGQVAAALKARGVRCFYHVDEQVPLWGTSLAEELPRVYAEESAAVVVFISADYLERDWTRLERRAAFSRAVTEDQVYVLPARFDDSELPGLLPDVVAIDLNKHTPAEFAAVVVEKLADRGIGPLPDARAPRVARPAGAVRVREADPRRLGVHAAISVPGASDEVPPEYVPRDVDTAEHGVRAKVAAAARGGGFVLLVGGSSVGKTRCAVEAVRALLPDWWLVHPDGPERVAALAAAPVPRTVIWLDELQRYLDGARGLTGGMVRELLSPPHPVVIIATLWPERYSAYTAAPPPGGADPNARPREVLDLATPIRVDPKFSQAELGRARAAAARDPRLTRALDTTGYGLTQTLAVAPQLVARWQDAQTVNPYAWAVLTAALDSARLGARAPLSKAFLRAAAPGYCSSEQQAEAPDDWFEQALAYAAGKLYGAAALSPAAAGMGKVAGYTAADYLIQHASRERRTEPVPASLWEAALHHLSAAEDAGRLAGSARDRLLYQYVIPLYQQAVNAGDRYAVRSLAGLLAQRGDWDEAGRVLRAQADTGDREAAAQLAELRADRGELDELRARADAGDRQATWLLADWLADWGEVAELRASAVGYTADSRLADWLADHGELDELRARARVGNDAAAQRLADLLADRGELAELRAWADTGSTEAAERLASLLADRDELEELRARADVGDSLAKGDLLASVAAGGRLADLLADRRELDKLRAWADTGDWSAAPRLAALLSNRGELGELRARADAGDWWAASRLADLLADRGELDELWARAVAGDRNVGQKLPGLLERQGRGEEAERLRRFGLNPDGTIAQA